MLQLLYYTDNFFLFKIYYNYYFNCYRNNIISRVALNNVTCIYFYNLSFIYYCSCGTKTRINYRWHRRGRGQRLIVSGKQKCQSRLTVEHTLTECLKIEDPRKENEVYLSNYIRSPEAR